MATLDTHSHATLISFLEAIRPWGVAYADATFGFIGVRNGDVIDLLQGHLLLPNSTYQISPKHIETKSVVGGVFRLADINESHESFLLKLSTDTLDIPVGKLRLMPGGNNSAPYAFLVLTNLDLRLINQESISFPSRVVKDTRDLLKQSLLSYEQHQLHMIPLKSSPQIF